MSAVIKHTCCCAADCSVRCKVFLFLESRNTSHFIMKTGSTLVLVSILSTVRSEIIKPWKEWLCNYCAMGEWEVRRSVFTCILVQELQRTPTSAARLYSVPSMGCCYSSYSSPSSKSLFVSLLSSLTTYITLQHHHQRNQRIIL